MQSRNSLTSVLGPGTVIPHQSIGRRKFLQTTALAGLGAAIAPWSVRPAHAAGLVVGFIYVGPKDDYGYNQAHAEGAAAIKSMPGITLVEEENVAETVAVQKTIESMINLDGAMLMFPTSFGYFDPHMLAMCAKHPKVEFRHCGGLWSEGKHPRNAGSYFGYIGMGQYLNGIVAAHASKSKKIGFIAAKPIPQVLLNINSFALGARSVDPLITCQVIFTGEWSLAVKEAEATNALIDQGIDVVTCHVDGPKVVVETAARRGAFVCGYHANQSKLAPEKYLTGAQWNWAEVYKQFVAKAEKGEPLGNFVRGGIADGFVKMSPYGPAVSDEARKRADAVKADILKGGYSVIKGPLKTNTGKEVVSAGKAYVETAIELESMDYLVALMNHFVEGALRDPASLNKPSTAHIGAANMISTLPGTDVHWGLAVGVLACVLAWVAMERTTFGFAARITGGNIRAARLQGLPVERLMVVFCVLGGAMAGLAGMLEVAAVHGRANASLIVGYGYTGILVAFLARQSPLAVIPVSILLGGIAAAGGLVQRRMGLPDATMLVFQGILFVMILLSETLYGRIPFLQPPAERT